MIVTVALLALAAAPKGLPDAELITWAPKVSEVSTLLPFFAHAGKGTTLLAPSSWRHAAHPLLEFDVFSPESIAAVGVNPAEGLALSLKGPVSVACHAVSDPKAFEAACKARLERLGTPYRTEANGVITLGTRDALNRVQAAAVLKGKEACAISGSGYSIEKRLPDLVKLLAKPLAGPHLKAATELKGTQAFLFPEEAAESGARLKGWATLSLTSKGDTLTVDGRAKGLPIAPLQGSGASPYARLHVPGVATVRARISPTALPGLMELFSQLPGGRTLTPAAQALAPTLSGNTALVFSRVKVTSGLRTLPARFFATRFVLLAEAKDVEAAKAVVDAVDAKALVFKEGSLWFGMQGSTVWLSNDAEAKERTLAALATGAGSQRHGAEFEVDPKGLAQALASVPLLEILQAPELSGVVVAATELGPLLGITERVGGFVDSTSSTTQSFQLTWALTPERADAGP